MYNFLASLVAITHALFILWVLAGGFLARRNAIAGVIQLSCLLWAIIITWLDFTCPLTSLEKLFLSLAGEQVYEGDFLHHYLWSNVQIDKGPLLAIAMMILLFGLNFTAYFTVIKATLCRIHGDHPQKGNNQHG